MTLLSALGSYWNEYGAFYLALLHRLPYTRKIFIVVYNLILSDSGLSPYTTYEYTIAVHNSAGSASSEFATARTHEDIPEGVQAPIWEVDQGVLDTIHLTWDQPEFPNGKG